ncbi:MAG: FtsL-like putative cell division protein [Phocaeicola plebeius]
MKEQQPSHTQKNPEHGRLSLRSILGGDFLAHDFLRRQGNLLIMIVIMTILYIDNRYSCQMELIELDRLKKLLVETKYDALAVSSELTEKSRQSRIEEYIATEESSNPLGTAATPPYLIKEDE